MVFPYLLLCSYINENAIVNNCIDRNAIVNDQLSALELDINPDMGHGGWPNVLTLINIHERSLFTSRFYSMRTTIV